MAEEIKYNFKEKLVIYSIASIVGMVVVTLCILLAAAVCLASDISDSFSTLIAGICLGVGALICGYISAKKIRSSGLLNGLFSGLIMMIIVATISLFVSNNLFTVVGISHILICLISASVGGIIGVNFSKKKSIL